MIDQHKYIIVFFKNLYCKTILKVILHQFWVKKIFPWKFNLEYGGTFTKLFMHVSSRNMFPTTRNLQIRVHVYRPCHCCGNWLTFVALFRWLLIMTLWRKALVQWLPIMTSWRKDKQSWMLRLACTHSWQWLLRNLSVSCRVNQFFLCNYSYVVRTHGIYIYIIFFINWTLRMSDNLPERVQILGYTHIICITVRENRIICCQIYCDLL